MEFYKNKLCVTFRELTDGDEPIINGNTLRANVRRGNITCVRQGKGEGNYALYEYASLPQKYKQKFEEKYGNSKELLKRQIYKGYISLDKLENVSLEQIQRIWAIDRKIMKHIKGILILEQELSSIYAELHLLTK